MKFLRFAFVINLFLFVGLNWILFLLRISYLMYLSFQIIILYINWLLQLVLPLVSIVWAPYSIPLPVDATFQVTKFFPPLKMFSDFLHFLTYFGNIYLKFLHLYI